MVYGAASVYKGINLRGREAYNTVPNKRVRCILRSLVARKRSKSSLAQI